MFKITPSLFRKLVFIFCLTLIWASFDAPAQTLEERAKQIYEQDRTARIWSHSIYAVLCFAGFIAIGVWLKRQKLKRTNKYGTEVHKSEGAFFKAAGAEGAANVAGVFLFLLFLFFLVSAVITCN